MNTSYLDDENSADESLVNLATNTYRSTLANRHLANTAVQCYSGVSAQLKSTFNQISRQSISSNSSSSSSTTESTCSSLPSSIVEILAKSNENLFKSAENLLKSKDESLLDSDDDNETVVFKSTDNVLRSDELILKSTSVLSTHEDLFKCRLPITDDSLRFDNLMSSSSSLDSSSFENIYSLYPLNKRSSASINKSNTIQELDDNRQTDHTPKKRSSNKSGRKRDGNMRQYLVKSAYLSEKDCLNCRISLIELSMKDRKSVTITIKWPLNRKNQKDKKISLEFRPTTKFSNQMINIKNVFDHQFVLGVFLENSNTSGTIEKTIIHLDAISFDECKQSKL